MIEMLIVKLFVSEGLLEFKILMNSCMKLFLRLVNEEFKKIMLFFLLMRKRFKLFLRRLNLRIVLYFLFLFDVLI